MTYNWGICYSPPADNEPEGLQVAIVSSPWCRSHSIFIWFIAILSCGLPQEIQEAISGCFVEDLRHFRTDISNWSSDVTEQPDIVSIVVCWVLEMNFSQFLHPFFCECLIWIQLSSAPDARQTATDALSHALKGRPLLTAACGQSGRRNKFIDSAPPPFLRWNQWRSYRGTRGQPAA